MISYKKLWKLLIDRGLTKKDLTQQTGLSTSTINKLNKGLPVRTDVLCKICQALDCDFGDIMEYIKE